MGNEQRDGDEEKLPQTLEEAAQESFVALNKAHTEKLSSVAKEIEDILIREEMTWGDWSQIVTIFEGRLGRNIVATKVTKE